MFLLCSHISFIIFLVGGSPPPLGPPLSDSITEIDKSQIYPSEDKINAVTSSCSHWALALSSVREHLLKNVIIVLSTSYFPVAIP